ncbi:unnamed protein product [Urochloa humidicola]
MSYLQADEASLLDKAIKYLKQLQLQMQTSASLPFVMHFAFSASSASKSAFPSVDFALCKNERENRYYFTAVAASQLPTTDDGD